MRMISARVVLSMALFTTAVAAVAVAAPEPAAALDLARVECGARPPGVPVAGQPGLSYEPITPWRLVDTRSGTGGYRGVLQQGCELQLDFGLTPVPATATALALSVIAVDAPARGYLAVYPCSTGWPGTSNINTRVGMATPNLVTVMLASDRRVCITGNVPTDVVVDLQGFWGPGPNRFVDTAPERLLDTRSDVRPGGLTGRLRAGTVEVLQVAGRSIPRSATSVSVNLTGVDAEQRGWLLAYPCQTTPPLASTVNFLAGEARAGAAIVGLSAAGALCLVSNVDVHVIVDLNGFHGPAPSFGPSVTMRPLPGTRVVDSRIGIGDWTRPMRAGETRSFDPVFGQSQSLASTATAAVVNVVATGAEGRGHLRIFPCGRPLPNASSVNHPVADSSTNLVTVGIGSDRRICVYAHAPTHVVIDLFALWTAPSPTGGVAWPKRFDITGVDAWPAFEPDEADYALDCPAPSNSVTFDVAGLPLTTTRIDGTVVNGPVTATLAADQLVEVRFTRDGSSTSYWFRCLPPDFPDYVVDRQRPATPGWYLTTFGMGPRPQSAFLVILDHRQVPLWYKRAERQMLDLKLSTRGRLAHVALARDSQPLNFEQGYRLIDLSGRVDEVRRTVGSDTGHHDHIDLPGGGWALITFPRRDNVDLTALNGRGLGLDFYADETVVDGEFQEFDSTGALVWSWNTKDHFDAEEVTFTRRFQRLDPPAPHGGEVGLSHMNSIDRMANGDYVVSLRHLDSIVRVTGAGPDRGEVRWQLTNPELPNPRGRPRLTIENDPLQGPRRPHDARLTPDGLLTLFDNRTGTNEGARAVAYQIDETAMTATLVWEYKFPVTAINSSGLGSVRRAPDGTTLIAWGTMQPMFEEIDALGRRQWALTQLPAPSGGNSYRIVKYPPATFDAAALRNSAGGNLEVPVP
jgi:hypothetical protein